MNVVNVATMGEVLDTFPVCASHISCIAAVPGFDCNDLDMLAGKGSSVIQVFLQDQDLSIKQST